MKVVIAIDSFKGSMSSIEAGNAAAKGILKAIPEAKITILPIADGGEGTTEALISGLGGSVKEVSVTDPIGDKVIAKYGIIGNLAVMEMAQSSGLTLVPEEKRNPMYTTTYGLGEMILDAIDNGCSKVFGMQKGASKKEIEEMDLALDKYSKLCGIDFKNANPTYPGAGAAGGLGFAFKTFLNASLEPGISIIFNTINLEKCIKEADIVVTGEGKIDSQTIMGKAPIGVAKLAKKYDKKVIAFCGMATDDALICNNHGIDSIFSIMRSVNSLDEAMRKDIALNNMTFTSEQVFRLLRDYAMT